jgi:hypothetical protein
MINRKWLIPKNSVCNIVCITGIRDMVKIRYKANWSLNSVIFNLSNLGFICGSALASSRCEGNFISIISSLIPQIEISDGKSRLKALPNTCDVSHEYDDTEGEIQYVVK